ncbi:hypothetical protein FSP39_012459 [Pinctada imbricata]|uniref:ATP-dependent DNA helicase n=1 Tax=Pinctada imbricata TaxID=66713 RepID=A0AA89BQQ8_PINIB|nr:hypothetical protein FSP39_012459 [Pinctada imbricata]
MPRKKFWKRGSAQKKGDSHPSNKGLTIDNDQVIPPVKKVLDDQVTPPVKKVLDQVIPPAKKKVSNQNNAQNYAQNYAQNNAQNYAQNSAQNSAQKIDENSFQFIAQNATQNIDQNTGLSIANGITHQTIDIESVSRTIPANECQSLHSSNESQEVQLPNSIHVFASHNQGDTRYSALSRGSQCTCMSLSMILSLQDDTQFSSESLDIVLKHGDNLYRKVIIDLQNTGKFRNKLLSFDDLPLAMEYKDNYYSLVKHSTVYGLPVIQSDTDEILSLHEGIIIALRKSHNLLIMIGAICSAITLKDGKYYFFDSHSHGPNGLSSPDGRAILRIYSTIDDLVMFLYSFYLSCNIDLQSQFEILPLSPERIMHNFPDFEPERKIINRQRYMKEYMQKKRKSADFRQEELLKKQKCRENEEYRQKELFVKQRARENEQNRLKESQAKKKTRSNKEYRDKEKQKELLGKKKSRQDETYRLKELFVKQTARENEQNRLKESQAKKKTRSNKEYRDKEKQRELLGKKKSRQDETYRQKELFVKQTARENEQNRLKESQAKKKTRSNKEYRDKEKQKELLGKKKSRQDETYRQKELFVKQMARDDEQYRLKELIGKRKARDDEQYRLKELLGKRKARDDEQYRLKELLGKRKARDDEQYRLKELLGKRKARDDEQYRLKELLGKRKARDDEHYRSKESEAKKKKRSDKEYRDKERHKEMLGKKKSRQDETYRQFERKKKGEARTNEHFRFKEKLKGLQSKQKLRKNAFFVESERLRKQQARRSKASNCIAKTQKRKDTRSSLKENDAFKKKKYGSTLEDCIEIFKACTSTGPLYVCTTCHQTWFCHSVSQVDNLSSKCDFQTGLLTGLRSMNDKEWICSTCKSNVQKNVIPKLSVINGMKWPARPLELKLHPMEERVVALRIPFMQMRELPRGGQYCVKGNVVNVPVDIQPTINALPRNMDKTFTIPIKLKKKLSYKKCDFTENVRPAVVISALNWLMKESDLYRNSGVKIDESWAENMNNDCREIVKEFLCNSSHENGNQNDNQDNLNGSNDDMLCTDHVSRDQSKTSVQDETGYESDNFSEIDSAENVTGNADTLLEDESQHTDRSYIFAPGEGQHPLSLYTDHDAEYLSFPSIFCGQRRPDNKDRLVPVNYSDIVKWELRSLDRRAAQSVPNIFFKLKKIQLKQISDKVHLAMRRYKSKGRTITASEARDQSTQDRIVRLDEGYYIFRQLRNSPAYLASKKKDVFAMIRQLGLPTWFMSLSSADTRWPFLLKALSNLDGKIMSDEEINGMSWNERSKLVQKDPVTCTRIFNERVQKFIQIFLRSPHNPVGHVTDYFYRVEFQQRGSPHIHMLVWVDDAPKYPKDSEELIVDFVNKNITCSDTNEKVSGLIDLQTHKHSKSCRKKGKAVCRFGFPLPPLRDTMLLEPLEVDTEKYKTKYNEIQEKINKFKDGMHFSYDQFLEQVADMPECEYIKCIRSSISTPKIFLKRTPSEIRINMYNEHLLLAWNANIDLQYVLDPYACAMYIVSYISKSQRGMSALMDRACREARQGNMDIKKQVRHIGNQFLNSVEVSAQEASYLVLQMPLTKASRDVIFINTSPPDERVLLLKQLSDLEQLSPQSTDIHYQNIIARYSKRPKQLENWCLADYASQLEIKYPEKKRISEHSEEANDDDIEENQDDSSEFSEDDTLVTLKNGILIRRRMHDLILRYVRYNVRTDPENHYREKLLLFMPWRDEMADLLKGHSTYQQHYQENHFLIDAKSKHYEKNFEEIELAMQHAMEELEQHDELAPSAQQANAEDEAEGQQEAQEFIHFNPDRPIEHRHYDLGADLGVAANVPCVECQSDRLSDEEYLKLLRALNVKQREFFNHVLHWIKVENDPIYAFLSGGAGVGKSVLIKALYQALHRHLHSKEGEDPDDIRILLCAFTGKAAFNINGVTIASAFHKKYNQSNQSMSSDELNTFRMKYRNLSVVIIDEISMVGAKMLNFIDTRLKQLTATNKPFGGISIIAVGDLYQLQPVGDSWIFADLSDGRQVLATNLWKEHFSIFELTQIMRQKDDMQFANLLNRLRTNELTEEDKTEIDKHHVSPAHENYPKNVPHLFLENKFVDNFNEDFIRNLSTTKVDVFSHDAIIADIPKKNRDRLLQSLPKDSSKTANLAQRLVLAVGMIYDITVNLDVNDGVANGSSCIIKYIENRIPETTRPSIVWVLFEDHSVGSNTRQKYKHLYHSSIDKTWTPIFDVNRNFLYNYKSYQRTQFPLKPAAAKTVHKAQGSTVDKLVIDMSQTRARKMPHIHYVAMSRVRKFENLHILNFNSTALATDERVKDEMNRLRQEAKLKLCYDCLYDVDPLYFKVAFNNARSFHKHFLDVSVDPNILAADVIGIMESRLCSSDHNETYAIDGFEIYRCDQNIPTSGTRPSHGLVLYLKDHLHCEQIFQYSTDEVEFLLCETSTVTTGSIQLVLVYKSPICTLSDFKEVILKNLLPQVAFTKSLFIMGDFNFDISVGHLAFSNFMSETFRCTQFVTKNTTNMNSMLDLVFSNTSNVVTETIECYWSDHKVVTAFI